MLDSVKVVDTLETYPHAGHPQNTERTMQMHAGAVAKLLGITEPKLNEMIRRNKIVPVPPVVAGRRLWGSDHIMQAAAEEGISASEAATLIDDAGRSPEDLALFAKMAKMRKALEAIERESRGYDSLSTLGIIHKRAVEALKSAST